MTKGGAGLDGDKKTELARKQSQASFVTAGRRVPSHNFPESANVAQQIHLSNWRNTLPKMNKYICFEHIHLSGSPSHMVVSQVGRGA